MDELEQIGVEAVVEGLSQFASDIGEVNSKIQGVADSSTLLERAFGAAGDILESVGDKIIHVAEYAIGGLLKDAIEGTLRLLADLGQASLESANNLQTLEIRLQGMNMTAMTESGMDAAAAMEAATAATKDQINWLQTLSGQTSFSPDVIANTYTLARSYSFTDEQARALTESITNFTAGMGLGDEAIKRIIINLGQMQQQGKITQRDLNDLARGAFVPVNEILKEMTANMQANGEAQTLLSEPIQKLKDKLADYQTQLEIAMQKQSEYNGVTSGVDQEKAAAALQNLKDKLSDYQNQLTVAVQKQSEFTSQTAQSTKMAQQMKIDKLRREIEQTQAAIDNFSESAYTMGSTVKQSTLMANDAKIDKLKENIAATTEELNQLMGAASGTGEITADMFDKMKKKGVPVQEFMDAFEKLVGERFGNSAKAMTRTLQGAIDRAKNFAQTVVGWDILKPVLDTLGARLGDFFDVFTKPDNIERFRTAGNDIARVINKILEEVLGLLPNSDNLVESIINGMEGLANWLENNRSKIVDIVKGISEKISEVAGGIQGFVQMMFEQDDEGVTRWERLSSAIGKVVESLLKVLGLDTTDTKGSLDSIAGGIDWLVQKLNDLADWINEHQEEIRLFLEIFLGFEIVLTVIKWVMGLVAGFIAFGLAVAGVVAGVATFIQNLLLVGGLLLSILANVMLVKFGIDLWKDSIQTASLIMADHMQKLKDVLSEDFENIYKLFQEGKWFEAGANWIGTIAKGVFYEMGFLTDTAKSIVDTFFKNLDGEAGRFYKFGENIVNGIIQGINGNAGALGEALLGAAKQAWDQFLSFWDMHSPSGLGDEGGANIVKGIAQGIAKNISAVQDAMAQVSGSLVQGISQMPQVSMASAMAPATVSTSYQTTNNFNLAINSSAQTEPIVQDFSMLQSLAGG